jgi:hypothetical protein
MGAGARLLAAVAGRQVKLLLLHEVRHIHQVLERRTFPLSYKDL